jgi:hypothetical protein
MNELKAIVMILGPITLWFLLTCLMLGYLLWRFWFCIRKKPGAEWNSRRIAFTVIAFVWVTASFWYGGGQNFYYDFKVDRLCSKDGGIKVYETVTLPAEKLDKWGLPVFDKGTLDENTLGPEYIYKWERTYLREGLLLEVYRYPTEITRRCDGKKLGEATRYKRSGGCFFHLILPGGPGCGGSYSCPSDREMDENAFLKQLFINSAM